MPIVKAFAGMTGEILDLLNLEQLDGLVIEALGAEISHLLLVNRFKDY